jgi:FAD/FMN-containing dehydrogenase
LRRLFEELRKVRGSVSAEHGLGQVKNRFMGFSKSPESIALMHQLRDLMDPQRILNPYKVTSDSGYVGIDVLPLHK